MRRFIAFAVVLLFAQSSQAVTLSMSLVDITGGTSPGIHTIGLYLQSDQNSSADDLGIAGVELEVLSLGTGNANFTGTSTVTFTNQGGFFSFKPTAKDANSTNLTTVAQLMPQPVLGYSAAGDGDLDALGFSFSTDPGGVSPGVPGAVPGLTNGFELVIKENWNFTNPETLNMYALKAQYFGDVNANTFIDYDNVVFVPEPSSLVLALLAGAGMATLALRRRVAK